MKYPLPTPDWFDATATKSPFPFSTSTASLALWVRTHWASLQA
ncbi:hypothetical protein GCM10007116_08050 [Sulfodiicoccus acidiphilus]|uniref:Uncharacterized protein n=1 Tax=Sulfodiicoccus acidiphilus TaxID=1670455 RepID=A0A830GZ44_9CREN|nr:hypothetical protein GCM10007116_08050 [Sulfodiicoccus acidiphilus]